MVIMNDIDVVALGELLVDFTCISTDEKGYPTMEAHPGGAPANYLVTISKLGAKTALMSKVGTDAFGRLLTATLNESGIDVSGVVIDDNFFTTIAFVTLDSSGNREFSFSRKPGADTQLCFEELNLSLIDKCKVFHFGTLSLTNEPSRNATYKAVQYARSKGKMISYDPNLRKPLWKNMQQAKEQLLWGLSKADIVKISDEELKFIFGLSPKEGAEYILNNYDVKLIFVTCGEKGCFYKNACTQGWIPALKDNKVIDTTGAGDIFGGSAMWKLLQYGLEPQTLGQKELIDIVSFACTAAALSTTKKGGISSIADYSEIISAMGLLG